MISKKTAIKVLNAALSTGGDYAEIYCEETEGEGLRVENGKVETLGASQSYGCGIRILQKYRSVYGYTSDLSEKSLLKLASDLAACYEGSPLFEVKAIRKQRIKAINKISEHLLDVPPEKKIAVLKECNEITKAVDPRLVRVISAFSCSHRIFDLFTAEGEVGKEFVNTEERGRLAFQAIAAGEKGGIEVGFSAPGRCDNWSYFTNKLDYKAEARKVGEKAILMLTAKDCPSGKFTVVIKGGGGGVLFHESCGHSLESTATAKHLSVFSDSIGKQIASPLVSAYDDGTIPNEWGSNNIDSEGHPTKKNVLIKDGICKGFLVDKLNGRRLGMEPNGTSRRQNFRRAPVSRMSNTYIAAGKDDPEQIIKDTKLGIYVADFGGGSVEPTTGEFNFSASEAYIIRDGKIAEPVKGCTLIGSGQDILMHIDRVGNDLSLSEGYCGAESGTIPVCVGQPTIRISEITVGGNGGELK